MAKRNLLQGPALAKIVVIYDAYRGRCWQACLPTLAMLLIWRSSGPAVAAI